MRLSETDASFVYAESASGPMHISSIYILEGELSYERVLERFRARLHLIPSYRRKLAQVPLSIAHPEWVDDPDFDLTDHVLRHQLPPGSTLDDGVAAGVALNEPMLDRSRPLWKLVVIEGVPGHTLILQATHHAMIDGASGIELTTILYDLDPNAGEPTPQPWQPHESPGPVERFNQALRDTFEEWREADPLKLFRGGAKQMALMAKATEIFSRFVMRPAILAPFNAGLVGPHRQVAWMKKSFADIREVRRTLGGTINDVVLAVVTEAVARYLDVHGERTANQYLRLMCPVNVRTEDQKGALGNQVSGIFPMLPAWPMEATERMALVIQEMERIKTEEEAQALTLFRESMPTVPPVGLLFTQLVGTPLDPTALAARVPLPVLPSPGGFRPPNPGINFVCTNVPGVQVPQYMCGHEVTDTIGLLVLTGNVGFSVTILSYNKQLFFSFICEPRLLPDLELIAENAEIVFGELLDAATARSEAARAST
jgi:diacylglycerol O-acyltransferase / wax synthase